MDGRIGSDDVRANQGANQISILDALEHQRMNQASQPHPFAGCTFDFIIRGYEVRVRVEANDDGASSLVVTSHGGKTRLRLTPTADDISVRDEVIFPTEIIRGTITLVEECPDDDSWMVLWLQTDKQILPRRVRWPARTLRQFLSDYGGNIVGLLVEMDEHNLKVLSGKRESAQIQ